MLVKLETIESIIQVMNINSHYLPQLVYVDPNYILFSYYKHVIIKNLLESPIYKDRFLNVFFNHGDIKTFKSDSFHNQKISHIALTHMNPYLNKNIISISNDCHNFVLYLTQCHTNALLKNYKITTICTEALAPITYENANINLKKIGYNNSNLVYKQ